MKSSQSSQKNIRFVNISMKTTIKRDLKAKEGCFKHVPLVGTYNTKENI